MKWGPFDMTCRPITILVVADNAMVRHIASTAFEAIGCLVLEAEDGSGALARLAAHPEVALLFANQDIPDMGGRELAAAARALRPELKVVVTTDAPGEAPPSDDLPFVPKPWTIASLKALVQPMIRRTADEAHFGWPSGLKP